MHRANTHSERLHVYRLEADNGLVGYGDAPNAVEALIGQDPWQIYRHDKVGMGPQIALLDLIGCDAGVPIHKIIGAKLRDRLLPAQRPMTAMR